MELAIKEVGHLDEQAYNLEYEASVQKIVEKLTANDGGGASSRESSHRRQLAGKFNVHCRQCGEFLFNAKDLKHRKPNYVAVSKDFIRNRIKIVDNVKFSCSKKTCEHPMGRLMVLKNSTPLHIVDIKGVKFTGFDKDGFEVFKQWSSVHERIDILDY
jgi:hypothetical protein